MKVFILAGGLGTRIEPQFPDIPKALIPVQGKPFLDRQIAMLVDQGFNDFTLCLGHRAEQIVSHFGKGVPWSAVITYSIEPTPLGTAGALKHLAPFFQETALVLNGDTYLDIDYRRLVSCHHELRKHNNLIGTLALISVQNSTRYGEVVLDEQHKIIGFQEKSPVQRGPGRINAGAYVFEPQLLDYIPAERATSLEREIFPELIAAGSLGGCTISGRFVDIGTPEGYRTLEEVLR